jgi:hypothetical protein
MELARGSGVSLNTIERTLRLPARRDRRDARTHNFDEGETLMMLFRLHRSVSMLVLGLMLLLAGASQAQAQKREMPLATLSKAVVEDDANLDVELYLLAASDAAVGGSKLPGALDAVVRQLRAALPFESYRLTATMLNRTRNGGHLEVKGVGATPFLKVAAPAPLFSEYSAMAKMRADASGQSIVEISGFRFGARIPVQTGFVTSQGAAAAPSIQYESTGITTEFSMREGEPVIVGTLNVGQSGEAFILVVSAHRTGQR